MNNGADLQDISVRVGMHDCNVTLLLHDRLGCQLAKNVTVASTQSAEVVVRTGKAVSSLGIVHMQSGYQSGMI